MGIDPPILAIGKIKAASTPRMGGDPKSVTVEVRTKTSMGQFFDMDIAIDALNDLVAKARSFLDNPDALNDPNILK